MTEVTGQKVTPVPFKKLLPLAIIYFIEAFQFTNIFAYVGFMVWDFHLTDNEDEVGYYAGYIGSTFSIAGFLSSFWWGRASDRYGRRPVLLFGCVGGLVSTLLFGFSSSLIMAISTRFAAGILNGNVGIVKGYAADICDKTNQIKGVSMLQLGWGLGGIVGPLFGGLASRPCYNHPNLCSSDSLFGRFPYLLPNLISCVASVAAIISLCIFLPREEPKKKTKKVEMEDMKKLNQSEFSVDDLESDLTSDVDDDDASRLEKGAEERELHMARSRRHTFWERHFKVAKDSILRNRTAMLCVLSYCLLGAAFTMYDEAFPLLVMTPTNEGGISASTDDIGIIGFINGCSAVFIQLVLFSRVANKLGFLSMYRWALLGGALTFINFPALHYFAGNKAGLWCAITFLVFVRVMVAQFAFSSTTALISNSCPLYQVGTINGFAQSLVGLGRAISPAVAGNLLAFGFSNGAGFPFNQYMVFILMSITMLVGLSLTWWLPESLRYPYQDSASSPSVPLLKGESEGKEGEDSKGDTRDEEEKKKGAESAAIIADEIGP